MMTTIAFLLPLLWAGQSLRGQELSDAEKRVHIGFGFGFGQGGGQGSGQGHGCQMPSVADHISVLSEKLNLSADQRAQIKTTVERQLVRLDALRKDDSLSREDRATAVRALRESSASKIRGALTGGQVKKFDEMRHDARQRSGDCALIWIVME